jgi:hypothetical protein
MKLILSADKMDFTVHWYMDELHQINDDCRGQVGCLMTMGKGDIHRAAYHNLSHVNSIVVIPEENFLSCWCVHYFKIIAIVIPN